MIKLMVIALFAVSGVVHAEQQVSASPADATAYIIAPVNGAQVTKTFKVVFGLHKMGVAPAGTMKENTGHHHLLIDVVTLPDLTKPLPSNAHVRHFGGGQTEATITLPKGKHTLQLILGNHAHVPHDSPVVSEKVTVIVQ